MARSLGLLEGVDLAREFAKGDLDKMEIALNLEKQIIGRMNVNGLTFLGANELAGVMITGSVLTPESGSFGLAVPKITFSQDVLGYEKETEQLCELVRKEVYAYRFLNKKKQLDMFEEETPEIDGDGVGEEGKKKADLI
jgi:hypothetical protein